MLGPGDAADRFTPGGLLAFGKEKGHAERLKHPRESPLAIAADDAGTLARRRVTIGQLREDVLGHFEHTHHAAASRARRIFAVMEDRMPEVTTADHLTPEVVEQLEVAFESAGRGGTRSPLACARSIFVARSGWAAGTWTLSRRVPSSRPERRANRSRSVPGSIATDATRSNWSRIPRPDDARPGCEGVTPTPSSMGEGSQS